MHVYCRFAASFALGAAVLIASTASSAATAPQPEFAFGAATTAHDYRDKHFDYFVTGNPALPRAAHTDFTPALMGGGGAVDAAYSAIARCAGGGHIVILRAISDDSYDSEGGDYGKSFMTQWGPVASAETIAFHDREASFDPRVIASLRGADGIFLAGGDQSNYVRYWKGTPVQELLNAHVLANRPIGGSSAGLAILGHYRYTAFDCGSMESKVALADPYNSGVTLESDFLHYQWLEHVITDIHFSKRFRLGRLIAFVARINREQPTDKVFGIGVDEKSAVLICADGISRLAAGSAGSAWVVMPLKPATVLTSGQPLSIPDVRIARVDSSGSIDLKTSEVVHASAQTVDSIVHGAETQLSIASPILTRSVVPSDED